MKKCRYPASLLDDFSGELIQEAHSILSLSLPEIYTTLIKLYDKKQNLLLLCILRLLLDIPVNDSSVVLVGWFVINGLVPAPTLNLFFHNLLLKAATDEGRTHLILFGQSILPCLSKYSIISNYLSSIPSLSILNCNLYTAVFQISHEPVQFESIDYRKYYVIPKMKDYYPNITKIDPPPAFLSNVPLIQPKPNIFSSIEFAATLSPDEQRLYCVNLCLTYSPPSVRLHFPPLLSAVCAYTRLLLYDSSNLGWNAFEIHPQLERMGSWICTLSLEHGPPPPLHILNIALLIRECAASGSLGHCLVFLNALFSRCSKKYMPPNPLTVSVLSVLSACYHVVNLRTDIKKNIERFCSIFNTNIELYHFREIFIPSNSFDCSSQFIQTNSQTMFQSSTLIPLSSLYNTEEIAMNENNENFNTDDIKVCNDIEVINAYFHYVPNREMLPRDLQELYANAERIEKYYFLDSASHSFRKPNPVGSTHENDQELLQCFVSLALADSPVLAKTAAKLFKKKTKVLTSSIDLCPLFRCAFPNRYVLAACLERKCFAPEDVNSLFSELLTNEQIGPIVRPMISSFMSMCFQYCPGYAFTSVCEILGIIPHRNIKNDNSNTNNSSINTNSSNNNSNSSLHNNQNKNKNSKNKNKKPMNSNSNSNSHFLDPNKSLPPPLKMHASLLNSFLTFVTNKDEKNRSAFFQKVGDASVPQIISLVSFVFSVTKKQSKQSCPTKIDYSAIDELCFTLGKCANRIYSRSNDKFISNCFEVAKSIAPAAPPLLLFRFVHGLLAHFHLRKSKEPIMELLENQLHPSKLPYFAICWLQLVMEKHVLPHLITTNEERPMQFCLNFVLTAISLLIKIPEVFYRGVVRILMTIAAATPQFFASYYALLIEKIPLRFVQLRNIILSACDERDLPIPFIGFKFDDELKTKVNLISIISKSLTSLLPKSEVENNSNFIVNILISSWKEEIENDDFEDECNYYDEAMNGFNNFVIPRIIWQFVLFTIDESIKNLTSNSPNIESSQINSLPISQLYIEIQNICSNEKGILFLLYNSIMDQLRYKNRHTCMASILIRALFENGNDDQKEIILVCLIKRLLCMSQPPKSVNSLFKQITLIYGSEVQRIFKQNGEMLTFNTAVSIINSFTIRKSKSANSIV